MSSDVEMDDSSHSDSDVDLDPEVIVAPDILAACKRGPAEYERVFSSAKKLITPEINRLTEEIIEAPECLK
jgi:hypothetical protein